MARKEYDTQFINSILSRTLFSCFGTINGKRINSRVMVFASTPDLKDFYCVTNKHTEKISEMEEDPYVNLLILSSSNMLDDHSETQIHGTAQILDDPKDKKVQTALDLLAEKSSMMAAFKESGSLGDYVIINIKVEEVDFRVYKDVLQNIPKTIIKP